MASLSLRRVLAGASVLVGAAVAGSACTRNVGLVLAIDTNVSVPGNIDEVGIVLSDGAGNVFYSTTRSAKGANPISLPAQLGVAPSDAIVHMAVVGFQFGAPKIFREAIGRSPSDVLAALQMGLDWEDWGSAELVSSPLGSTTAGADAGLASTSFDPGMALLADAPSEVHTEVRINGKVIRNTCARGKTSVGGRCINANFEPEKLQVYSESLVYGGDDRKCFPRVSCFPDDAKQTVNFSQAELLRRGLVKKNEAGDCMADLASLKSEFDVADKFNVGVRVRNSKKVIVINRTTRPNEGGWIRLDERMLLVPDALCNGSSFGEAQRVVAPVLTISRACESKTRANPLCENSTSVTTPMGGVKDPQDLPSPDAATDAAQEASVQPSDAGGEASAPNDAQSERDAGVKDPNVAEFQEVTSPSGSWVPSTKTLAAVDMIAAPGVDDKLLLALSTRDFGLAGNGILQGTSALLDRTANPVTMKDLGTTLLGMSDGTTPPPVRLSATALGAIQTVMSAKTTSTPPNTTVSYGSVLTRIKFDTKSTEPITPCSTDAGSKQQLVYGATVQTNGAVLCTLKVSGQPVARLIPLGSTGNYAEYSIPTANPIVLGGIAEFGATQAVLQPGLWVAESGYQSFGTSDNPNWMFFGSDKNSPRVQSTAVIRRPDNTDAALMLTKTVEDFGPTWNLWRMNLGSTPEIVGEKMRLDSVQDITSGPMAPSHHPYAVSGQSLYFLHKDPAGTTLQLAQYSLDTGAKRELTLKLPLENANAFDQVYSVAVTQALVGGVKHDRVYVAASVMATRVDLTPGFKLWAADVKL